MPFILTKYIPLIHMGTMTDELTCHNSSSFSLTFPLSIPPILQDASSAIWDSFCLSSFPCKVIGKLLTQNALSGTPCDGTMSLIWDRKGCEWEMHFGIGVICLSVGMQKRRSCWLLNTAAHDDTLLNISTDWKIQAHSIQWTLLYMSD